MPGTKLNNGGQEAAVDSAMDRNRQILHELVRRFGWLYRIRPQSLAEPLYRLVRPYGGRAIIEVEGVRLFIDPFTTHGMNFVMNGHYEADVAALVREKLPIGGTFLDIGANEGVISSIAARHMGPQGLVIAVEPQIRLRDLLEINLALNSRGTFRIIEAAITAEGGDTVTINLGPTSHSGGSSLVRSYRWGGLRQEVAGRSVDSIVAELGERTVDLMKVDVEGFEPEVVRSARASLADRRIACLAVDYHNSILVTRGITAASVDAEICSYGYRRERGAPETGYTVYVA